MSKHFLKLKKRMEEEKRPEFDFYFLGFIHGLGSAGVLEEGEEGDLLKLLNSRKEKRKA